MQHGKEKASVEGFKKFLEQEKTNPHKNSAMLDQIIGEIEHCEALHLQSVDNAAQSARESSVAENTANTQTTAYAQTSVNMPSQQEPRTLDPKTIGDSFNELKVLFETYELVEAANGIGLIDRKTGEYVKKENNLQQLVERVTFAKKWIEAAGVDLSLSGGMNEFGIDPKQYEMAFNDGARATFASMFGGLAQMGQIGQKFDLNQLQHFVLNGTGYKYSSSLIRGLLANPQGEEVYLPQNAGVPAKKPWEYSVIKREIENIALANQMAKTADVENSQSAGEIEPLQTIEEVSEIATPSITSEQLKIRMRQKEKLDEIADFIENSYEEANYRYSMEYKIGQYSQAEWDAKVSMWTNTFETRKREKARYEARARAAREKTMPSKDERCRIYALAIKVGLLESRMYDFSQNGQLKEMPEQYIQAINNTIQNLLHLSDKTIVSESGQSKTVTEVIGRLWDMSTKDAIACVESELASGKIQDPEIIRILQDFAITKTLEDGSYSCSAAAMPLDGQYWEVYNRWGRDFIENTQHCYTIEDVYENLGDLTAGLASYFFNKKKDEYIRDPNEFTNDEEFAQLFLRKMKNGVTQLEMSDDLAME
jgi:hypothetical protein